MGSSSWCWLDSSFFWGNQINVCVGIWWSILSDLDTFPQPGIEHSHGKQQAILVPKRNQLNPFTKKRDRLEETGYQPEETI